MIGKNCVYVKQWAINILFKVIHPVIIISLYIFKTMFVIKQRFSVDTLIYHLIINKLLDF